MRVLFIVLMVLVALPVGAQVTFGAYAGVSNASLKGDSPKNFTYQPRPGIAMGAMINIPIKPDVRISLQPGYAIYRPTMAYPDEELGELRDSLTMELDYIRLSVLMDIISDNEKWHFYTGLDPQIGVRQKATSDAEEFDLKDEMTQVNLQIIFGLGHRIRLGTNFLDINLQFTQGILNITDNPDDVTSLVPRIKTSAAELIIAFEFGQKIKSN